jgi:hypothetical protein
MDKVHKPSDSECCQQSHSFSGELYSLNVSLFPERNELE